MRLSFQSLPDDDNLGRFAYSIRVDGEMFIRKGKMIAYFGSMKFEAVGSSLVDILFKEAMNAPLHVNDFVVVQGQGKLVLGDNGLDIAAYNLEDATFTLKAEHVLGFQRTLRCQESTLPGYLTLIGSGRLLASSNGPVVFVEPPCRVDEDAVVGWADLPSPSYRYDYQYVQGALAAVGAAAGITRSGEEKQLDFYGNGTVLVQSSEDALGRPGRLASIVAQLTGLHASELQQLSREVSGRMAGRS